MNIGARQLANAINLVSGCRRTGSLKDASLTALIRRLGWAVVGFADRMINEVVVIQLDHQKYLSDNWRRKRDHNADPCLTSAA
jgi:hypothetical protein